MKGILHQYLDGFSLSDLDKFAPQSTWQGIVDQAVKTIHVLNDNNILNADVCPSNFIVVPRGSPSEKIYRVFMIDFRLCRFRGNTELDLDWGRAKSTQDEEGAVGAVMKHRLKKAGFDLVYQPSWRYLQWAPGEND